MTEERKGQFCEVGVGVGVAGQFDDGQALVADGGQSGEYRREVDLPGAEREVFMDAAAHVLDLDVAQPSTAARTHSAGDKGSRHWQWPMSRVRPRFSGSPRERRSRWKSARVARRWPGSGSTARGMLARVAASRTGASVSARRFHAVSGSVPAGVIPLKQWTACAPRPHGHPDRADQQVDASGTVVRVGVQQGGTVFAPGVEHIAGARLHGDRQPELVQPVREAAGAGGQVRRERVQVHVVEGQPDAVVAEVGEEGEGVVETEVGEAVGSVAEAEGVGFGGARGRRGTGRREVRPGVRSGLAVEGLGVHVTLTFLANLPASGARAAVSSAVTGAPERAERAAWRGMVARMPPPTARWVSGGDGLRAAWK